MGGAVTGGRLLAAMAAWLAGVALQLQQRSLWSDGAYLVCIALAGMLALLAWRWRKLLVPGLAGLVLLAFASTGWRAAQQLAETLPAALEGRDLQVTGVVASLPQSGPNGLRFRFDIEQARLAGEPVRVPGTVALGWYKGFHEDAALTQPQAELRAGQRWRFTVRLRQPHGNLNPHGFDYELQLFEQGLRATGYVRDVPPPQRLADAAGHPVERLRQHVRDGIFTQMNDRRAAGVLAALAVGDQAAIERDDWDLFRNTGLSHLMAISGLHITMLAWLAGAAVAWGWRRSTRLMLVLPAPLAERWGGLLAALAYSVFAGWGVPAQRTVWMLATVVVLATLGLRWPWTMVLLASAVTVSVVDPWALLQPGFWLSFVAVGLLMASEPVQRRVATLPPGLAARLWMAARGGLRTQAIATLGLAPLTLLFFQQISLVGFAANLIAIPLITLVVTPLALLGALVAPLWNLAAVVLQPLFAYLTWLASWPLALWTVPVAPPWAQACGLLAGALLVMPLPWRLRALAVPLALPFLLPAPERPAPGHYDLVALDVGQGTSVLVRTRDHLLVYDAGPQYSRDSDAGQRVLLPLLRARGEARIDTLVLSHRDSDHVGGARALLASLPVGEMLSSLEPEHPLRALAPHHTECRDGQGWTWDGVRFELLHPQDADVARNPRPNALSCVLRISAPGQPATLLTGDIEREQEAALLARHGADLRSDVLVVPHHGSKTSSTPEFLAAVQPRVAVFQAGYRNRFGHPAPEVLARYHELGIATVTSPACGAWTAHDAAPPQGECERDAARRYWHHRPADAPD